MEINSLDILLLNVFLFFWSYPGMSEDFRDATRLLNIVNVCTRYDSFKFTDSILLTYTGFNQTVLSNTDYASYQNMYYNCLKIEISFSC